MTRAVPPEDILALAFWSRWVQTPLFPVTAPLEMEDGPLRSARVATSHLVACFCLGITNLTTLKRAVGK